MGILNSVMTGGKSLLNRGGLDTIGGIASHGLNGSSSDAKSDSAKGSKDILSDLGSMANDAMKTVTEEANINNKMNHNQALADESMDIEQAEDKTAKKGFDNLAAMAP